MWGLTHVLEIELALPSFFFDQSVDKRIHHLILGKAIVACLDATDALVHAHTHTSLLHHYFHHKPALSPSTRPSPASSHRPSHFVHFPILHKTHGAKSKLLSNLCTHVHMPPSSFLNCLFCHFVSLHRSSQREGLKSCRESCPPPRPSPHCLPL